MLRRVQCTYRRASWLAVVPVALVAVSCGGSPVGESVSGPSVVATAPDQAASDVGTLSELATSKTLLCHKGQNKRVPPTAVAGHLRHGDSLGSCSAPAACPCFSSTDIQATAEQCGGDLYPECSATAQEVSLTLNCDPGGNPPPYALVLYLTKTADGGSCSRQDASGSFDESPLTAQEYQACAAAIEDSGFCF